MSYRIIRKLPVFRFLFLHYFCVRSEDFIYSHFPVSFAHTIWRMFFLLRTIHTTLSLHTNKQNKFFLLSEKRLFSSISIRPGLITRIAISGSGGTEYRAETM